MRFKQLADSFPSLLFQARAPCPVPVQAHGRCKARQAEARRKRVLEERWRQGARPLACVPGATALSASAVSAMSSA